MGASYVLGKGRKRSRSKPRTKAGKQRKIKKVMSEYKRGALHSGSKKGPVVTSRVQAQAIAMSESGQTKNK